MATAIKGIARLLNGVILTNDGYNLGSIPEGYNEYRNYKAIYNRTTGLLALLAAK